MSIQVHMRVHNKPNKEDVEKQVCHICHRVFKSKSMLDKHVSKHTESTAEEYEANIKTSVQGKRRGLKRSKEENENNGEQSPDEDASTGDGESETGKSGLKRKQLKPNRVVAVTTNRLNDVVGGRKDFDTVFDIARKRLGSHFCTYCNATFDSIALLNSHIKLHIRDKVMIVPKTTTATEMTHLELPAKIELSSHSSTDQQNSIVNNEDTIVLIHSVDIQNIPSENNSDLLKDGDSSTEACDEEMAAVEINLNEETPTTETPTTLSMPTFSEGTASDNVDIHFSKDEDAIE